jgi:hypothetical protein
MFVAPNKVEYVVNSDSQTGLLFYTPVKGGAIPLALAGYYTGHKFVTEAWNRYLSSDEMRKISKLSATKRSQQREKDEVVESHEAVVEQEADAVIQRMRNDAAAAKTAKT